MTNKPPGYRNNVTITINSSDGLSSPSTSPMDFCENPVFFETSAMSIGVASCYALLIPLTLLGNGWVIVAFVTNSKLRTTTNIFIAGLASSDMLVGVFSIPVWTFISAHENIAVGYCLSFYAVYISLDIFAGCASILQLTAISIERFVSVQWPLTHRKLPLLVYCFMLLLAWLCATIMAALQPLQTEAWRHIYTVVLFVACFFCPLVIVFTCYFYIFKISHFQAKPKRCSSSSGHCGTPGGTVKERKVVVTVAVITGLFLIAWLPFFVVNVIATFCLPCLPAPPGLFHLVKMLKLLQYASSAVNPYIYAYRNAEMRQAYRKITRNFICCRRFRSATACITRNSQQSSARLQRRELHYHSISKNNSSFDKENFVVDIGPKTPTRGKSLKNVKTKTAVVYL